MKKITTITLLSIVMICCAANKKSSGEQTDSPNIKLDGFWLLSHSDFDFQEATQQRGCPDPELMAVYDPHALGSHFLIRADSILFFRYPYQYFGSAEYRISADSLFVKSDFSIADKFLIQITGEDSLLLNFHEKINQTCIIIAEAGYERFTPDWEIVDKLIQDSVSYDPLVGKWWYLRKKIGYNDGSEPTILKFPRGMPDSIFVSQEIISRNSRKPYIDLKLNNRNVKMLIQHPQEYSFTLSPELISDEILFSDFIDYGGGRMDTIYYDVIYE